MEGRGCGAPAYAGVDTHKDTNMLGLVDGFGRELGTWEFPATPDGYARLAERIGDAGVPVGVEGTRSYGAGLALHLSSAGFSVREVIRPRREQRRRGKTDAADALSAAHNVAAGRSYPLKATEGEIDDLRARLVLREQLVDSARRAAQRIDALVVTAPADVRERWRGGGEERIRRIARSRPKDAYGGSLKELAKSWEDAHKRAVELEDEIAVLARSVAPALIGALGVGPVNAAKILVAVGSNPGRLSGEAAFSMLAGTSPIPASSGKTCRHRLNRGGNRQLNCAIHSIALVRMQSDKRTRAYIERKVSEGKSKREAIRCLCRYVAREVYRLLTSPAEEAVSGPALADRRRNLGLTQREVAEAMGVGLRKVGRLENENGFDDAALRLYAACLDELASRRDMA